MRHAKRALPSLALLGVLAVSAGEAAAEESESGHNLGVGYKIGNVPNFVGADVILRYLPHASLDLQVNYITLDANNPAGMSVGNAQGFGLVPGAQLEWRSIGHTPYIGAAYAYGRASKNGVAASYSGVAFNLGYQLRFASGVGALLGLGVLVRGEANNTNGTTTVHQSGGAHFNYEAGLRYYF